MVVADIAYGHLTPEAKSAVDALLQRHRDYALWMSEMPASYPDRARFAFMKAATWPDDVRKTPDDRPIWHYVDVPVIAPGYTPDVAVLLLVTPNAETQIPAEATLLADPKANDADRAVALCWVVHLVGDVHQPLHDSSFFSPQFPQGDRGGNSDLLAPGAVDADPVEAEAHPHNLHALWDDLFGTTQAPAEVQKIAAQLETPAFAQGTYPQIAQHQTVHEWVLEGNALARDVVYQGGKIAMTPDGAKADIILPTGYLATAHAVAARQAGLAGWRLAGLLNAAAFPPLVAAAPPAVTPPAIVPDVPGNVSGGSGAGNLIIGNARTHVYHLPGEAHLPAEKNRVYFKTEAEAQAAGYHAAGRSSHSTSISSPAVTPGGLAPLGVSAAQMAVPNTDNAPTTLPPGNVLPAGHAPSSPALDAEGYNMQAPLIPDPRLTPGAVLPVTVADLSVPGYTKKVRDVPQAVKEQVYRLYGITHRKSGEYEVDHLISLELGGSNRIENLWPESYHTTPWNAHVKDRLENTLHALVVAGKLDLATAQKEEASDWIAAYRKYVGPEPGR